MKNLSEKIRKVISQADGTWGIMLQDLDNEETMEWNTERAFPAASIIKVPIMVAAYRAFREGIIMQSDYHTLRKDDLVGGSGVLQHLSTGTQWNLFDLLQLMIFQSDNTATNIMIDKIGFEAIRETMMELGFEESAFHHRLMVVPAGAKGKNIVSARDMANMLAKMASGKVISMYACQEMISILKKQQITDCLPAALPDPEQGMIGADPLWQLAHKTGTITEVTHDMGIFYVDGRSFSVVVLSEGLANRPAREIISYIGKEIYRYLTNDIAYIP